LAKTYYGELKIPVIVLHGVSPGKKLLLSSGVHGTEYVGMDAMLRLVQELDTRKMKGTLVAIPFLNVPAFETVTREGPFDSLNLNRIFRKESRLHE
jgi:predicted deacylase